MSDAITLRLGLDPDWRTRATCRRMNPAWFAPERGQKDVVEAARYVCLTACPVINSCRAWVMAFEDGLPLDKRHGIYAGLTRQERLDLEQSRGVVEVAA